MAFTTEIFHPMLSASADTAVEASLHTSDPGDDGSSEIDGGDYERQTVSWNSPADGAIEVDDDLVFAVPELDNGDEITHVGLWDSDGEYLGALELATPQPYPTPGTLTVEPATLSMSSGSTS